MADKKNPLTIRLTESAVFLRSDATGRPTRSQESRPSMLRGLLILELSKPTRITSIELELVAKSSTAWPEGIGARRTEITEEHKLFHSETVYFRAGKVQTRRNSSVGPGVAAYGHGEAGYESDDLHIPSYTPRNDQEVAYAEPRALYNTGSLRRNPRRLSADSSFFQRVPLSHEEFPAPPTPPYSPFSHPSSPTSERQSLSSAQTLEEFRNSLNAGLWNSRSRSSGVTPTTSSVRSYRTDAPLSRRPSIEDVPENELSPSTPRHFSRPSSRPGSRPTSRPASRTPSRPPSPVGSPSSPTPGERRGRTGSRSRFSLSSVSSVLIDAVRSSSPKTALFPESNERVGDDEKTRRGRTKEKGKYIQSPSTSAVRPHSKEKSAFSRIGDMLKLDHDETPAENGWKEFKKGTYTYPISFSIPSNSPPTLRCNYGTVTWRLRATVHRPGAFKAKLAASREVIVITCPTEDDTENTENIIVERHWDQQLQYLISVSGRSFYIGGTVPITFTLMPLSKMKVHRISVFIEERIDYYTHMKRIARTDPPTHIALLSIKEQGKHGGHILPLDSDDVDAFRNSSLFALVTPDDDPSEMASSLMGPGPWNFHQDLQLPTSCSVMRITNKNRRSNVVITHQLKCVMRVERGDDLHLDPKTGKRKLFDIVIQTPIHILSCRCNPEWSSLPRYSESFEDTSTVVPRCPCDVRRAEEARIRSIMRPSALERMTSRQSADSFASAAETSPVSPGMMPSLRSDDSLYSRSNQYERLISGQESEMGEAPPTYTACLGLFSQQSH
ncbi:hypothetical protein FPV67DRAFT_1041012 [Lyophyllum atratum]|nr:hypothetical protein FPV67DRAFT_1041012 [Lyophyllum atratum]